MKTEILKDDLHIQVSSWGAALTSCRYKGRELTLFPQNEKQNPNYMGVTVGRYANRIKDGQFSINQQTHQLTLNNGKNSLHGGKEGFSSRNWDQKYDCGTLVINNERVNYEGVLFTLTSIDGDQGFPGEIKVESLIALGSRNRLIFIWRARCDQATLCNLTNHTYWNLSGITGSTIRNHQLELYGPGHWPIDHELIPEGDLDPRKAQLSEDWDHCFVNDLTKTEGLYPAAKLISPDGLSMFVETSYPGLQVYTGNFLAGDFVRNGAICLEPQYFPDAPNQAARYQRWGSTQGIASKELSCWDAILTPGEQFEQMAIHHFQE